MGRGPPAVLALWTLFLSLGEWPQGPAGPDGDEKWVPAPPGWT